jgi:hypothetical protein
LRERAKPDMIGLTTLSSSDASLEVARTTMSYHVENIRHQGLREDLRGSLTAVRPLLPHRGGW